MTQPFDVPRPEAPRREMGLTLPPVVTGEGIGIPAEALDQIVVARNLVVLSNWVGNPTQADHEVYQVGRRVHSREELEQLPHRMTTLTKPFIDEHKETPPAYYLTAVAFADPAATHNKPRETWATTERYEQFLLAFKDAQTLEELRLREYLTAWGGLYAPIFFDEDFTQNPNETLSLKIDRPYPPHAQATERGRVELTFTEDDPTLRLIRVNTDVTRGIADRIIALNTQVPTQDSRLF